MSIRASETLAETCERRLAELGISSQEQSKTLDELVSPHQKQRQHIKLLPEQTQFLGTPCEKAPEISSEQRLPQFETHADASPRIGNQRVPHLETRVHGLEERFRQSEQEAEVSSEQLLTLFERQTTNSTTVKALADMCGRRLSELENALEHQSLHRKALSERMIVITATYDQVNATAETVDQRLAQLEHMTQKHQEEILELTLFREEHQPRAKALSEHVLSTEAACAKAHAMIEVLTESCEQRLSTLELGKGREKHDPNIQRRLSNIENEAEELRSRLTVLSEQMISVDRLDELGKFHDKHQQQMHKRLAQLENSSGEHENRLNEHALLHEEHRQYAKTFCETKAACAKACKTVEALEESCEGRLATLERESQELLNKSDELSKSCDKLQQNMQKRLSQVEKDNHEHSDRLNQHDLLHEEQQGHAKALSQQLASVESACAKASKIIEALGKTCEGRLETLESGFQEHGHKHDELCKHHEKHLQQTQKRMTQLDKIVQDYGDRLHEHGSSHDEHQQNTKALSEQIAAIKGASNKTSKTLDSFAESCEGRLHKLEMRNIPEDLDKLVESIKHIEKQLQNLFIRFPQLEQDYGEKLKQHGEHLDEHQQQHEVFKEQIKELQATVAKSNKILQAEVEAMTDYQNRFQQDETEIHENAERIHHALQNHSDELDKHKQEAAVIAKEHTRSINVLSDRMGSLETECGKANSLISFMLTGSQDQSPTSNGF